VKVEHKIAWRYLWGKKSHNAINIVSGVSAAAVMVVTAAMVCVMSVMNGFGTVIEGMFSQFDPDLKIVASQGKVFSANTEVFDRVRNLEGVALFSETIEETALVEFEDKQLPAVLKGVDSTWAALTHIEDIIVDGQYCVWDGGFYNTVMGIGLSNQLRVGAHFIRPVHLYAPKREGRVNRMNPSENFRRGTCYMAGVFAVNQLKYDDRMMLVDLRQARQLFDYEEHVVSAVEVKVSGDIKKTQKTIAAILGEGYQVMNRYEQQADFFRILRIEKWLTALLMVFILLIASFNIIGSLTMLMIDKKEDVEVLKNLGASPRMIQRIFRIEGWLISAIGAVIGLLVGVGVCLAQEYWGLIKLGTGTEYVLEAYPVHVEWMDLAVVAVIVIGIGLIAAWWPTRLLGRQQR